MSSVQICLVLLVAGALIGLPAFARAEDASSDWDGVPRLNIDLTAQEAAPFVQLALPRLAAELASQAGLTAPATTSTPSIPLRSQSSTDQKSEWRKELAQEGQASLDHRDDLTADALNMAKWTFVTLVLGAVCVMGFKHYQQRRFAGPASGRIKVLETLMVGRSQGLKLVEVAGERFLIASDQGGIKSVTLLPSWPQLEQEETPDLTSSFPGGPRLFQDEHSERAAG